MQQQTEKTIIEEEPEEPAIKIKYLMSYWIMKSNKFTKQLKILI